MALITQHSTTLLELLQPVPDSVHAAADLVAYSHLILPWVAVLHATQALTTAAAASQPQLPQLPHSLYAEVLEIQLEDLQCVRFETCTPGRRLSKHADCIPVWLNASHDLPRDLNKYKHNTNVMSRTHAARMDWPDQQCRIAMVALVSQLSSMCQVRSCIRQVD